MCSRTPPGLRSGPRGSASSGSHSTHLHLTKNVHKALSPLPSCHFYYLHISPSPLFDLARLQTCCSHQFRFIIIYHFANMGNISVGDFYFHPSSPCKRDIFKSLRSSQSNVFLYIPRLLYSPNCSNK